MSLIEKYLPTYQFKEQHYLWVNSTATQCLDSISKIKTSDDRLISTFISLREIPNRFLNKINNKENPDMFGINHFTFLERNNDKEIALGLIGRFWRLDYGIEPIKNGEEFLNFNKKGMPKLLLNFSIETDNNQTKLVTETRVFCNNRQSLVLFSPYWYAIRPVSGFIRRRLLKSIDKISEWK